MVDRSIADSFFAHRVSKSDHTAAFSPCDEKPGP